MFESLYFVLSWACRRACPHCYDDRFRPYAGDRLHDMVAESREALPGIIENLPDTMRYIDLEDQTEEGGFREKTGRVILSGGEVLMEPVRSRLLYPALEMLWNRYGDRGGVKLVIQTAGDLLTPEVIGELLERKVWMISVSSIDDFHADIMADRDIAAFKDALTRMFEASGMRASGLQSTVRRWHEEEGPVYSFFGATPDAWIGKLWPSGRAWENGLSTATYADNFCGNWSGGLNFLNFGYSGSEVSIDPEGNVYPCCRKTRLPYGNLREEPLADIIRRLIGEPVFEAIAAGHPERMGLSLGVSLADFIERCRVAGPNGRAYVNRCIGCDRVHEEFLGPVLARLRRQSAGRER